MPTAPWTQDTDRVETFKADVSVLAGVAPWQVTLPDAVQATRPYRSYNGGPRLMVARGEA